MPFSYPRVRGRGRVADHYVMPTSHTSPEEFDVKLVNHYNNEEATSFAAMSLDDKKSVLVLLLLYTLQGIFMVVQWYTLYCK